MYLIFLCVNGRLWYSILICREGNCCAYSLAINDQILMITPYVDAHPSALSAIQADKAGSLSAHNVWSRYIPKIIRHFTFFFFECNKTFHFVVSFSSLCKYNFAGGVAVSQIVTKTLRDVNSEIHEDQVMKAVGAKTGGSGQTETHKQVNKSDTLDTNCYHNPEDVINTYMMTKFEKDRMLTDMFIRAIGRANKA